MKNLKKLEVWNSEIQEIISARKINAIEDGRNGLACPKCNHELYDYPSISVMHRQRVKCTNTKCNFDDERLIDIR